MKRFSKVPGRASAPTASLFMYTWRRRRNETLLNCLLYEKLAHSLSYFIRFVFLGPLSTVSEAPGEMPVAFLMLEKMCLGGDTKGRATVFGDPLV